MQLEDNFLMSPVRGSREKLRMQSFQSGSPVGRARSSLKYDLGNWENEGNNFLELLKGAHMGGLLSNVDAAFSVSRKMKALP